MIKTHLIYLHIDHALKENLEIKLTLDSNVIFHKLIEKTNRMPPIIYNNSIKLESGKHIIEFSNITKNIKETNFFIAEDIKTIIIKTRKDILTNSHIVFDTEKTPIK